ncbi:hypothetical protein ACFQMA_09675 [Halosimplex aquaticum]|uniref:DUF7282 domain-containing protein n=1 Tax=Halosimplex aquaticum TaxID=3026162 RepID=A0ABD5XZM8_9EURY|nr:hypothetical protein [Halosimplex aquaticum]
MLGNASRRVAAVLVLAVVLATPVAVATVSAHGDHVAADSQMTGDGTVVVETVSALTPGFVVLRADDGGTPGESLGHTYVGRTPDMTYMSSVPVSVDESAWAEWSGNRTVWAVLHDDMDGNGEFDAGTDTSAAIRSAAAQTKITVRKSDSAEARVLGARFDPQPVGDGTLTVRRVDLPASGHVSVRPVGTNETIGSQSLAAGSHENVTVELDESYVADQSRDFRVHVVAHRDDGDGSFGPEDPPITAGDRTVGTYLVVSPDAETDDGPVINTPTVTTAPGGSATPSASATASATASDPATTDPAGESTSSETDAATGTAADGPGFGVALAVLVVVLSLVAARSHRR